MYILSSTTTTINARLTPYGRKKLLSSSNTDMVSYFAFGDSDANYACTVPLSSGEVPAIGGDSKGSTTGLTSSYNNISLRDKLIYSSTGSYYKPVGSGSFDIFETVNYLGNKTVSGDTLQLDVILREIPSNDSLSNLLNSFGIPLTTNDITKFRSIYNVNGGYADTAIKDIAAQTVICISIPGYEFGEVIDGKTLRVSLPTTYGGTYVCYGTYQRTGKTNAVYDSYMREEASEVTPLLGDNIVLLFSDGIKRPNDSVYKSWSQGYGSPKPFSYGGKELYNFTTSAGQDFLVDKAVGVAFLDKGFVVITNEEIVNNFVEGVDGTGTTITFNSVVSDIGQVIVCEANVGDFKSSTNTTFTSGVDRPRVTEIGLYDKDYQLVAIAKLNKPYILGSNYFRAEVKITV